MAWLLFLAVLAALIALLTVPFFSKQQEELGVGLEVQDPSDRWTQEKNRLLNLIHENDHAFQEGRIDGDEHGEVSRILYMDAEHAMENVRSNRSSYTPHGFATEKQWLKPAIILLAVVCGPIAIGVNQYASLNDIKINVSPHADGRIPIEKGTELPPGSTIPSVAKLPLTEDGQPDVAQMVGRLEARIADGGASKQDYAMLLRSYGVLNRQEDMFDLMKSAVDSFPKDAEFQLTFLRMAINKGEKNYPRLLEYADRILTISPQTQEAMWYRGLLLHRLDRKQEASVELQKLSQMIAKDHPIQPQIKILLGKSNSEN